MRKIRKVIADSDIIYFDHDGKLQKFHTIGNIRTIAKAVSTLMAAGIVNVLIDDVIVHKTTYAMDVDTFVEHAERIVTDTDNDNDNDIDNDNDNDTDNDNEPEF